MTILHKISESESSVTSKCDIQMIYLGMGRYTVATKNADQQNTSTSEKTISELVKKPTNTTDKCSKTTTTKT